MIIRKKNKIPGKREKARHQIAGCTPFDQLNVTVLQPRVRVASRGMATEWQFHMQIGTAQRDRRRGQEIS